MILIDQAGTEWRPLLDSEGLVCGAVMDVPDAKPQDHYKVTFDSVCCIPGDLLIVCPPGIQLAAVDGG